MLVSIVPLFDADVNVKAYSLFTQKENSFLSPQILGVGQLDGAGRIDGLEVLDSMGMATLSDNVDVLVPVSSVSIFSDVNAQCHVAHDKVVLLLDNTIEPTDMYVNRLKELKQDGYKFAIRKLEVAKFELYREILNQMDYILLNHKKIEINKAKIYFSKVYPNIKLCAVEVDDMESFEKLKESQGYQIYEGAFFRNPSNQGSHEVSPLKVNYVQLLGMINGEEFELTKAADIIGRDTALVISLLKIVNRMTRNSTITSVRHAAAMMGENELKKWITTAVTEQLCTDRPSEITRLSMLRAKFAENLAPAFNMAMQAQELFLMGLFSALDVILEVPMEEALDMVLVSGPVKDALAFNKGKLATPLEFIKQYGDANWQEVSRMMIVENLNMNDVYKAYTDALSWYRDTIMGDYEVEEA